jgi:hypothetical protein
MRTGKVFLIVCVMLASTSIMMAQMNPIGWGNGKQSDNSTSSVPGFSMPCLNKSTSTFGGSSGGQATTMPMAGAANYGKQNLGAVTHVTSFGIGGLGFYTTQRKNHASLQFGVGFMRLFETSDLPPYGATDYAQSVSVIPMFVGFRYYLFEKQLKNLEWTGYAFGSGGPVLGMSTPPGGISSLFNSTFRFGGGLSAGLGTDMRFETGLALYAQFGFDYLAFIGNLGSRSSYLGPAISFGFAFAPKFL